MEVRSIQTDDGLALAYTLFGADQPATPLFVPALSWVALDLEELARTRPVVFHDVRGRGRSARVDDATTLSLERDVADLEGLRAHLASEDPAFASIDLMGWSYYGALVARYALAHRAHVRRFVLVGPSPPRSKPWFGRFLDALASKLDLTALHQLELDKRSGLRERDPAGYSRRAHHLFHRAYVVDDSVLERMRSDPVVEPNLDADRVNDQSRRVLEGLGDYDWRSEVAGLDAPALIVHGRHDPIPFEGSEEWCDCLPNARMALMDAVGHMPWLEEPEGFRAHLEEFLS